MAKKKKSSVTRFIILHRCPDVQPAWFGGDNKPVIHKSEKKAQIEMIEDYIDTLKHHLDDFKRGERQFEEIDLEPDSWVDVCEVHPDGCIYTVDGEIYNPKTFVR